MGSALEERCQARVGSVLQGKWKLERLLGVGGMAAVYAGHHRIGRHDAIKILHPDIARQADLKKRFEIEATATNRFHHPGAVEIRDFDVTDDGCPFMVMEMLDGESLGERARRLGEIKEPDVLRYTDELLDVLAAAHKEGIIHRDIKLDNLFITTADHVKVLDFGIARIVSGAKLTRAGMRLGTTAYMPPEQLRGGEVDGRADLFAVGATMFRLLAKRRIHEAGSDAEMVMKMSRDPAPKLRDVAPGVSPNTALIVDRALAFDVSDRYPSAETMQADVRAVRNGQAPAFAVARATSLPAIGGSAFALEPTGASTANAPAPSPGFAAPSPGFAAPAPGFAAPAPGFAAVPPESVDPRAADMTRRETASPRAGVTATEVTRREAPAPSVAYAGAPSPVSPTIAGAPSYAPAMTMHASPVEAQSVPESITLPRPTPAATPKSNAGLVIAIGVGALALLAAVGGYFFLRTSSTDAKAANTPADSATATAPDATATSVGASTDTATSSLASTGTPTPSIPETGRHLTPMRPPPQQNLPPPRPSVAPINGPPGKLKH